MVEEENMVENSENLPEEASENWGGSFPSDRSTVGIFWWLVQWGLEHAQKGFVEN